MPAMKSATATRAPEIDSIVRGVGEPLRRLEGRTIFLTGCTGFLGGYVLETLAHLNERVFERPCRVRVATRSAAGARSRFPHLSGRADFKWIEGDVRSIAAPRERWDFVIHAAAPSDAGRFLQDPAETMDAIVGGTGAVLRAAARARPEAMLLVSSGAVYGTQPADLAGLPEDWNGAPDPADPRSCYGEAKRCAEVLAAAARANEALPISVARVFTVLGPGQESNSTSAVVDFLRQARALDTISIRGDGDAVRSYCYAADAVTLLWKILLDCPPGQILNVGSDLEPITFRDLAARAGRAVGKAVRVEVLGRSEPGVLGRRYVPDLTRLVAATGFRPKTALDHALRRTAEWMDARQGDSTCA
jgi:dTDP-glucose 4,6-dehydratase